MNKDKDMPEEAEEIMLRNLFRKEIYRINEPAPEATVKSIVGSKKQDAPLLVVVADDTAELINDFEKEILSRLLSRIGIDQKDVAVINIAQQPVDFIHDLHQNFQAKKMISFGVLPEKMGLHLEQIMNRNISFFGWKMIFTTSLKEIDTKKEVKQKFWNNGIVPMFHLTPNTQK